MQKSCGNIDFLWGGFISAAQIMCPPVGIEIKNDVDLFSDISGKERNKEGSSGSNNGKIGFVYNLSPVKDKQFDLVIKWK